MNGDLTVLDLFSGAGGLTLGLAAAGFRPVWAVERDPDAAASHADAFGDHVFAGDIVEHLAAANDLPEADLVVGGPPCQGFSLLNKQKDGDPRRGLWEEFVEVVERVEPLAFLMENVPPLIRSLERRAIETRAEALGYAVCGDVLNAADFGVPQRRRRAFLLGVRREILDGDEPTLPAPTHRDPEDTDADPSLSPWTTVRDAIGDLPVPRTDRLRVGEVDPPLDLHFRRNPTAKSVERYKCVPEGGNRLDLERKRPDITPRCWLERDGGGTDLFGRLWWDRPAFTIRTEFFKPEKGRYLHPSQHRPITHREAARLQTFPDDFIFHGSKTAIARQIGNAVPPLLARRLGEHVAALLGAAQPA